MFDNNTCNNCGDPIVWWNPENGQPMYHTDTNNKRPFNPKGGLHLCMKRGQDKYFPKRPKGSRITDYAKDTE